MYVSIYIYIYIYKLFRRCYALSTAVCVCVVCAVFAEEEAAALPKQSFVREMKVCPPECTLWGEDLLKNIHMISSIRMRHVGSRLLAYLHTAMLPATYLSTFY
jgi:hypothetical protein